MGNTQMYHNSVVSQSGDFWPVRRGVANRRCKLHVSGRKLQLPSRFLVSHYRPKWSSPNCWRHQGSFSFTPKLMYRNHFFFFRPSVTCQPLLSKSKGNQSTEDCAKVISALQKEGFQAVAAAIASQTTPAEGWLKPLTRGRDTTRP